MGALHPAVVRVSESEAAEESGAATWAVMTILDLLQWPAMVVTVIAAWMVGSQKKFKRNWGFWLFLFSNVLWIVWGWHDHAYALILLQLCLAFINIRGALKNRTSEPSG